jgi:hypothetical protein
LVRFRGEKDVTKALFMFQSEQQDLSEIITLKDKQVWRIMLNLWQLWGISEAQMRSLGLKYLFSES